MSISLLLCSCASAHARTYFVAMGAPALSFVIIAFEIICYFLLSLVMGRGYFVAVLEMIELGVARSISMLIGVLRGSSCDI